MKVHSDVLSRLETTPLKSKVTLFSGYNVGSQNKENARGPYQIVRLSDVDDGKLHVARVAKYGIKNNARIERYVLNEHDVILSARGTSLKVATVPKHDGTMLLSQNFIGIRCGDTLHPAFLKAYLESPVGKFLLTNKLSGTAIPTLRWKDIEALEVPDIPIKKQETMMGEYLQKERFVEEEIARLKLELEGGKEDSVGWDGGEWGLWIGYITNLETIK